MNDVHALFDLQSELLNLWTEGSKSYWMISEREALCLICLALLMAVVLWRVAIFCHVLQHITCCVDFFKKSVGFRCTKWRIQLRKQKVILTEVLYVYLRAPDYTHSLSPSTFRFSGLYIIVPVWWCCKFMMAISDVLCGHHSCESIFLKVKHKCQNGV